MRIVAKDDLAKLKFQLLLEGWSKMWEWGWAARGASLSGSQLGVQSELYTTYTRRGECARLNQFGRQLSSADRRSSASRCCVMQESSR